MTSKPASRRARATTLAPRSWPSSPGLATTTRMRPCAMRPSALSLPPGPAPVPAVPWEDTTRPAAPAGAVPPPRGAVPDPDRIAYLPPRAARARKLILRRQLGRGWILAAAAFGLVILAAGGLWLARGGRPGAPWVRVAPLAALPAGAVTETAGPGDRAVVVDRRGGDLRAFVAARGPCPVTAAGTGA